MDEPGLGRSRDSDPHTPAHEQRSARRQAPRQGGGGGQCQDRNERNQEAGRRVEPSSPHRPRPGGQDHRGPQHQEETGLSPIFAPELEKTRESEGKDGCVDQQSELLIEQKTGEALGQRRKGQLGAAAVDPAGVKKSI